VIHPTAIVDSAATLDASVEVGPYSVIEAGVSIGPGNIIGPHVVISRGTAIGARNRFHAGCVIGDAPQDLKYRDEATRVVIGDDNVFREHFTVHRSTSLVQNTAIGSHNFFMANSHVGHNCVVGNHVIVANGALLAGHVTIQDRVFISGNCLVHQFTRVGTLAMMQGGSGVSKDLPPFTIARRQNEICGLNIVGLRRAGFTPQQRIELKRLYHALFRSGKNLREAVAAARDFTAGPARTMLDFLGESQRGFCAERSGKLRGDNEEVRD